MTNTKIAQLLLIKTLLDDFSDGQEIHTAMLMDKYADILLTQEKEEVVNDIRSRLERGWQQIIDILEAIQTSAVENDTFKFEFTHNDIRDMKFFITNGKSEDYVQRETMVNHE